MQAVIVKYILLKKIIWHQIVNLSDQDREKGPKFPFDFFKHFT